MPLCAMRNAVALFLADSRSEVAGVHPKGLVHAVPERLGNLNPSVVEGKLDTGEEAEGMMLFQG